MPGLRRRANHSLDRFLPEKRLFIQTSTGTSYRRLTPLNQLGLLAAGLAVSGWVAVATAAFVLDRVDADGAGSGALVLEEAYEARLAALTEERDRRAAEALSAQHRFRLAMDRIGQQQTEILRAVEERRELALALDVMRARLGDLAEQRDLARAEADSLRGEVAEVTETLTANGASDLAATLERVTGALADAVRVRDRTIEERDELRLAAADLEIRLATMSRRNEEMLAEIEYAVRTSFDSLEGLFEAADLDLDSLIATVRRDYSGTGGGAVRMSTRSYPGDDALSQRFDELLVDLDRVNLMRIAAGRVPYAMPVTADHRFTSGFGYRRDPKNGRRRMHAGIDLAAPRGTPIYATADGVVISAGTEGGYGQTVRIRHEFGFETLYAHKSNIRVEAGQKVSRGDHIGDMGATGRATGVHLHYEVRLNGQPVNPMVYLEAARDVF